MKRILLRILFNSLAKQPKFYQQQKMLLSNDRLNLALKINDIARLERAYHYINYKVYYYK